MLSSEAFTIPCCPYSYPDLKIVLARFFCFFPMDFKSKGFPGGGGSVRWPGGAAAARDERGAAGHREVLRAPHGAEARARGARAQRGARVQQRAVRGLGAGHRAQEHSQDTSAGENNAGADKSENTKY